MNRIVDLTGTNLLSNRSSTVTQQLNKQAYSGLDDGVVQQLMERLWHRTTDNLMNESGRADKCDELYTSIRFSFSFTHCL